MMSESEGFCIVKLHSGEKRICRIGEIYVAGERNKYTTPANRAILKRAKNGAAQTLRIWNGDEAEVVTVIRNSRTKEELEEYLGSNKRLSVPKPLSLTPAVRQRNVTTKELEDDEKLQTKLSRKARRTAAEDVARKMDEIIFSGGLGGNNSGTTKAVKPRSDERCAKEDGEKNDKPAKSIPRDRNNNLGTKKPAKPRSDERCAKEDYEKNVKPAKSTPQDRNNNSGTKKPVKPRSDESCATEGYEKNVKPAKSTPRGGNNNSGTNKPEEPRYGERCAREDADQEKDKPTKSTPRVLPKIRTQEVLKKRVNVHIRRFFPEHHDDLMLSDLSDNISRESEDTASKSINYEEEYVALKEENERLKKLINGGQRQKEISSDSSLTKELVEDLMSNIRAIIQEEFDKRENVTALNGFETNDDCKAIVSENVALSYGCLGKMYSAKTMKLRLNHLITEYWSAEDRQHLIMAPDKRWPHALIVQPQDINNIQQVLTQIQNRKKLTGKQNENWELQLRSWISGKLKSDRDVKRRKSSGNPPAKQNLSDKNSRSNTQNRPIGECDELSHSDEDGPFCTPTSSRRSGNEHAPPNARKLCIDVIKKNIVPRVTKRAERVAQEGDDMIEKENNTSNDEKESQERMSVIEKKKKKVAKKLRSKKMPMAFGVSEK